MPEPILTIDGLGRTFGETVALDDVTGTLAPGEVLGLIGPNGGGKSTLLLLIAGLLRPTSGSVRVDGVESMKLASRAAGVVGLVTAESGLYPLLTGAENLHYFASLFHLDDETIGARSRPLLELFDLVDAMDSRVSGWSTGMQQRLSLVRALITEPRLLLFDEPTANLDPGGEIAFHGELRRQADQGRACILVTHRLAQAESVCDRVWFIDGGIVDRAELDREGYEPPKGQLFDLWKRAAP